MKPSTFYLRSPVSWKATEEEPLPDVGFVPPLIRRRMTPIEKITLYLIRATLHGDPPMPVVFASQHGEWSQTHKLLAALWNDREVSPAAFTSSVHNASLGIASMVMTGKQPYTAVAARERTLEAGLLEALISPRPVLFVAAEEKTVDFYAGRTIEAPTPGHGVGVIVAAEAPGSPVRATGGIPGAAPLTLDGFLAFFTGETPIETEHFCLTRL